MTAQDALGLAIWFAVGVGVGLWARWAVRRELERLRGHADDTRRQLIDQLDRYHAEWAGFNRETNNALATVKAIPTIELRLQEAEHVLNRLRIEVADHLERAERLFHRLRMRYAREEQTEPTNDHLTVEEIKRGPLRIPG